jgi:YHS domain-containing protein
MRTLKILSLAIATLFALPAAAQEKPQPKPVPAEAPRKTTAASPTVIIIQKPCYPMTTCVACGKPLPEKPVEYVKDGRLYRLDSDACQAAVDADAAAMKKKIDAAVIAQQKAKYPLKTSVVSGQELGATAVDHVYGTRLVRLANPEEVATLEASPDAALTKLDKAYIEAQLPGYAMKTCPVSKEELGGEMGEPVNYLYGTKLVRFCCKKCIASFEKDPDAYLKGMTASK